VEYEAWLGAASALSFAFAKSLHLVTMRPWKGLLSALPQPTRLGACWLAGRLSRGTRPPGHRPEVRRGGHHHLRRECDDHHQSCSRHGFAWLSSGAYQLGLTHESAGLGHKVATIPGLRLSMSGGLRAGVVEIPARQGLPHRHSGPHARTGEEPSSYICPANVQTLLTLA
jgi:hypothetical protein